ncbi:MAG: hypothetical protein AAFU61_06015, partial [Pseudomonadota bacterium]
MPTFVELSASNAFTLLTPSDNENVVIAEGVGLVSDFTAVLADDNVSIVQGPHSLVVGFSEAAYDFLDDGQLTVSAGAVVQGGLSDEGIILLSASAETNGVSEVGPSGSAAIRASDAFQLRNAGEIHGGAAGLRAGPYAYVSNDGLITGIDAALLFEGAGAEVFNAGVLRGNEAVRLREPQLLILDFAEPRGVLEEEEGDTPTVAPDRISNTGAIEGGFAAIRTFGRSAEIVNQGTLVAVGGEETQDEDGMFIPFSIAEMASPVSAAILHDASFDTAQSLTNAGSITAAHRAYSGSGGVDDIVNTGRITGDVMLYDGDDRYIGRAGLVEGTVGGGDGEDMLVGGAEDNALYGGADADILRGRAGEDVLDGGDGADLLNGGAGDDDMDGGENDDVLRGKSGDDLMAGG